MKVFWGIVLFVLFSALIFFTVSLVMASVHSQTLLAEWQSWFGVVQDAAPLGENALKIMIR